MLCVVMGDHLRTDSHQSKCKLVHQRDSTIRNRHEDVTTIITIIIIMITIIITLAPQNNGSRLVLKLFWTTNVCIHWQQKDEKVMVVPESSVGETALALPMFFILYLFLHIIRWKAKVKKKGWPLKCFIFHSVHLPTFSLLCLSQGCTRKPTEQQKGWQNITVKGSFII